VSGGAASRRAGAWYERLVTKWLNENGYTQAERRIMGMSNDKGDICGVPCTVIECKNQAKLDLGVWFSQMEREQVCAEQELGALFIRRRGTTDVGHHYVVVSGYTWLDLMSHYRCGG
jgi:hypothetical protein